MINKKFFFKGFKSILAPDSPALALGCCFIAIGALLKNLGFNIQESIFSTMLTYALPGSLVMAESLLVGASLLNIFLAVWFVNARLYPMAVSLFPLMMHKIQLKYRLQQYSMLQNQFQSKSQFYIFFQYFCNYFSLSAMQTQQ